MNVSSRILSILLAVVLAVSCLTIGVLADSEIQKGVSFVNADALRLRSGPSTSYSTLDVAYEHEVVVITDRVGNWYKVIYNLQEGYMHSDYLNLIDRENVELGYGKINAYCVNLRSGPSTSHSILTQAYEGDTAYIIGINCGWYKVIYDGQIAYVRSDLLDLTEIPYENDDSLTDPRFFRGGYSIGQVPNSDSLENSDFSDESYDDGFFVSPVEPPEEHLSEDGLPEQDLPEEEPESKPNDNIVSPAGQRIADTAKQYLGVPYVWGGASPNGFDCSGLVQYVVRSCGYAIARTADNQYNYGTYVEYEDLLPGDIVFFANTYTSGISHVGIYIGDGEFIHAPNSGSTVKISSLESSYYNSHYYGARRMG